jgi:hypothetical protein
VNKKLKTFIGLFIVVALLIAQQPVAQGPQASNSAAWKVTGTGAAGSSDTGVVTIQGIASGTPVPVSGGFQATPQATSSYAGSAFDLAATAATQVKATAGNVWGWYGYNPNATTCFLQFYNSASASLGTSPLHQFGIVAGGSFNMAPGSFALFNMSTAISTGETTTATGSSQCSSAMLITIIYD